ncbi:MAG: 5-oxoprolinase subunit PxpA [Clostridiaceae bacterium]|nr:5-oxoprolinase subunit PxpA [Clostridiaceae bacterium]
MRIDLNCDLGESYGSFKVGMDKEVIPHVTSVNVACGYHGGDPVVMEETVKMAVQSGAAIGAHPSFPDLMGFGRRDMKLTLSEAYAYVKYQLGALYAFARTNGVELQHLKAHGALYNMAGRDITMATALAKAIKDFDSQMLLLGLPNSKMEEAAGECGIGYVSEFFADRAYNDDGSLVARSLEGSVIHDSGLAVQRVIRMVKEGVVETYKGGLLRLNCSSVCVHGDNKDAVEFVKNIRNSLEKEGVEAVNMKKVLGL